MDADVIVVGLGAHGSAAVHQLAKRGLRVLGLDRLRVPHEEGSSGGESRIIRQAYHEDPVYVPFVQRAYDLWAALEREVDSALLIPTGGLLLGEGPKEVFAGAKHSADVHQLAHRVLTPGDLRDEFPTFAATESTLAVYEPRAGVLRAPQAIEAHLTAARRAGAELGFEEPVLDWQATDSGVTVRTSKRSLRSRSLVLSAGAWMTGLAPAAKMPLVVERQVMAWFRPDDPRPFAPGRFPIFIWQQEDDVIIYGFPDLGNGVKVGIHHQGALHADPAQVDRTVRPDDLAKIRRRVAQRFPTLGTQIVDSKICLYSNTPDDAFILDRHPAHHNVVLASCCSGHGFKFAPAVGEAVAQLIAGETPRADLWPFRMSRFAQ